LRTLFTIAILLGSLLTHAQNVNRVEYYFDTDPGLGNGIAIPITEAPDLTRDFNIPLNTTSEGFHLLYIRAKSSGLWSIPFAKAVFVQRNAQTSSVTFIDRLEYFFDTDPGLGNGISIPITAAPDLTRDFNVPLNTISEGFHLLYLRAKSNGSWSIPFAKPVFVQRNAQTSSVTFIDRLEYFFDTDPGWGNGIEVPITTAADISQNFTIPLTAVSEGFHVLYYRARNAEGYWSIPLTKPVFVQRNAQTATTPNLKQIEFFIDTDPGLGNGTQLPVSGTSYDELSVFDISSVPTGFHVLYIRTQDENEQWSKPFSKPFFIELSGSNIVAIEYYFDDGATQTPVRLYSSFTPGKNLTLDFAAVLQGLLSNTTYTMHLVAVNADGQRSTEVTHTFMTPAVICDPITAPAVVNATLCGSGSVTLTASGATATQDYQWYTSATEPNAITGITGNSFTTPKLTNTTTYFVTIRNGTCESIRTQVTAFINPIPTAPLTINNSACGVDSTVTLTATGGTNGYYRWYEVATGGTALPGEVNDSYVTPPLTTTTTYYVSLDNGSCESPRTAVMAIINPVPPQPSVTSSISLSGNALTICGSTALTLRAPAGFATYAWSNGATTQQIIISTSGTFSVTVTDVAGCSSPASAAISITVIPAPCNNQPPVISSAPLSTIIGGSVTLNILNLISDADNNLVAASLRIVQPPGSRANTTLANGLLTIDYSAVDFAGKDQLTIEVCDIFNACTQKILEINVSGDIEIFNGLSPNNDGLNDIFLIQYIDLLPDTQENKVTIYNRWGSKVFEVEKYNNTTKVFRGLNDNGNELPSGTYFYKIEFENRDTITGYLTLKR